MSREAASALPRIARSIGRVAVLPWRSARNLYAVAGAVLSAGLLLVIAGLWGLSILTEEVMEGDTVRLDRAALLWLNGHASPWLDQKALEITALGDGIVVTVIVAIAATLLWLRGPRVYAALLVVAASGAGVLTTVLKNVFDRPRPQVFEWRAHYPETSFAYPSGHAIISMVTMVVLAFIVHRLAGRLSASIAAGLAAGMLITLTGLSRLYLGVHYPSDVLAGYAVGFAWAVLCALAAEIIRSRTPRSDAPVAPDPKLDRLAGARE